MSPKVLPPTQKRQAELRAARASACFKDDLGGTVSVLIGVPLTLKQVGAEPPWAQLAYEFQSSLTTTFEPFGVSVRLAEKPISCDVLSSVEPLTLSSWLEHPDAPLEPLSEPRTGTWPQGPYAWIGWATAKKENLAEMSDLLFKVNAGIGKLVSKTTLRMDALLEEQGVRARTFPPTAFWNSLSVSRIAHARLLMNELGQTKEKLVVRRVGQDVLVRAKAGTYSLAFPEETNLDLAGLFAPYGGL